MNLPMMAIEDDLEARIAVAEAALMARQLRLSRRGAALVERVEHSVVRQAGSGLVVTLGALALAWWARRRRPSAAAAAAASAAGESAAAGAEAGALLASLIPLLWPLLPRAWRKFLTLDMASTACNFAAPLLARLFRRRRRTAAGS